MVQDGIERRLSIVSVGAEVELVSKVESLSLLEIPEFLAHKNREMHRHWAQSQKARMRQLAN